MRQCLLSYSSFCGTLLKKTIVLVVAFLLTPSFPELDGLQHEALSDNEYKLSIGGDGFLFFEILHPEELRYTYKLSASAFAPPFNSSTVKAPTYLVLSDPFCGCGPLRNRQDEVEGNVVLVDRGECSFISKALRAQEAGASGVIVTNDDAENDNLYISMIDDGTARRVSISAAFLLGKTGHHIRKILERRNVNKAVINIPVNMSNRAIVDLNQPPWLVW